MAVAEHQKSKNSKVQSHSTRSTPVLLPRERLPLQDPVRPVEVPGGGRGESPQLSDGLAHGAGVVGQTLDVLEGQVDDLVAAGVAVQVTAGQALQTGLVRDAALAVREVGAQGQRPGQGAALQAAAMTRTLLRGRPCRR